MFDKAGKKPGGEDLARGPGRSWTAWEALTDGLAARFGPLNEEWKFTGARWGWSLRLKRKDRTIIYLLPIRKSFRVTLVLGDKALRKAFESGLPEDVMAEIKQAKKYPEGTAVRFEVRSKKVIPPILRLAEAKMSR